MSLRPAPVCLLSMVLALGGCGSGDPARPDGGIGPDGGPGDQPERRCETTFRYQPDRAVDTVEVAGEWDWEDRVPMAPAGGGAFAVELELPPGIYAYKIIVDDEWILDPEAGYRAYDGGLENSAVRVGDCRDPRLVLEDFEAAAGGTARAELRLERGNGGPAVTAAGISAELVHDFSRTEVDFELSGAGLLVELSGLAAGKYTLELRAADDDGRESDTLRVPFWIEDEPFDWRSPIYMMMIDRFRNGDPSNDDTSNSATPSADWHGGDLAGVADALEEGYFDELGIEALWLSPFQTNPDTAYVEGEHAVNGYHGYWPIRAREIDPRFGTEADLERLVRAAHARGIRVLMDFVINHVHEEHEYFEAYPEWFRTGCKCGDPGCGWTERRLDCLFQPYLPDLNWENRAAAEAFVDDALWWLTRFDLDGLRVDAVKHVEDAAVTNLATRIDEQLEQAGTEYFLLGETAMGWAGHSIDENRNEYDTISRYIGRFGLNGQFDFVLYHAVAYNVFAYDTYGMLHADFWTRASLQEYPADSIMTPFVGSHDSQRFISLASQDPNAYNKWPEQGLPGTPTAEGYDRARVAFTWVLTLPGAPLLYYGDEYGEWGGSDPDNRHMWRPAAERSEAEEALFEVIAAVGRARQGSAALRRGDYRTLHGEEGVLAFARTTPDDLAVVVLNHSPEAVTRTISLDEVPWAPDTLRDALAPEAGAVPTSGGEFELTLPPRSAAVLLPD